MPLIVEIVKFEQSHDGYCTDNEEFENRIVKYKKEIGMLSQEELEKLNIFDGEEIPLKKIIELNLYKDLILYLELCEYGSMY